LPTAQWPAGERFTKLVVAAVISQHGEAIAGRYLDHQAVESKRALDKYLACYKDLGYEPLPAREQKRFSKLMTRRLGGTVHLLEPTTDGPRCI